MGHNLWGHPPLKKPHIRQRFFTNPALEVVHRHDLGYHPYQVRLNYRSLPRPSSSGRTCGFVYGLGLSYLIGPNKSTHHQMFYKKIK